MQEESVREPHPMRPITEEEQAAGIKLDASVEGDESGFMKELKLRQEVERKYADLLKGLSTADDYHTTLNNLVKIEMKALEKKRPTVVPQSEPLKETEAERPFTTISPQESRENAKILDEAVGGDFPAYMRWLADKARRQRSGELRPGEEPLENGMEEKVAQYQREKHAAKGAASETQ